MSATRDGGAPARLVVVSGPSGVGKSAVVSRLLLDPRFGRAVTATTRAPRPGEQEGVDYFFLERAEFVRRLDTGWFLEHAEVYGRLYGTPRSSVDAVLASGRHCVLVIDTQGAATLRRMNVAGAYVFLEPPSLEELVRRLMQRGGDPPESFERRMREAAAERAQASLFDKTLVNRDLDETTKAVAAFVGVSWSPLPPGPRGGASVPAT